jgi:hypothetical protein
VKTLRTAGQIIDALGGTGSVAALTRRKDSQIARCRRLNKFPPQTFLLLITALKVKGFDAPVSLWSQEYYAGVA